MALIGIDLDKKNPPFTKGDFIFWMPQFANFINTDAGLKYFNKLYTVCNNKIFESIFGSDWELAISYAIAHYLTLISNQMGAPSGNSLDTIYGGGTIQGVLTSASVGSFSKNYDVSHTLIDEDESKFWNQTSYGAALIALLKTKSIPSIMVVTSGPISNAN